MDFVDKLTGAQARNVSALCVSLDIVVANSPLPILVHDEPMLPFARAIIEATANLVCAYKVDLAYYFAEGAAGMVALERIVRAVPADIPLIIDLGAGAYGPDAEARQAALLRGAFVQSNADAVVLWPYGREAALTAAAIPAGRFVFFESPAEEPMYALHHMAQWSVAHPGQIGLVAHTSRMQNLSALRKRMPGVPFLIRAIPPAGEIAAVMRAATPADGPRPILCAGAEVLYASRMVEYQDAARAAALALRDQLNAGL